MFGGTQLVASGGTDIGATVHGGGELDVLKGGRASGTLFTSGGLETVSAGGLVVSAKVAEYRPEQRRSRDCAYSARQAASSSAAMVRRSSPAGGVDIGATVLSGGFLTIHSGGLSISATLSGNTAGALGAEFVRSGGRTSHTVIDSGGFLSVSAGGLVISTIVNSTGVGTSVGGLLLSGAAGGSAASATLVNSGGQESIHFGGKDIGGTVNSGGKLFVKSGGIASRTTVIGVEIVSSGGSALANIIQGVGATGGGGSGLGVSGFGLASGTVLKNGGEEGVFAGGTDISATVIERRRPVHPLRRHRVGRRRSRSAARRSRVRRRAQRHDDGEQRRHHRVYRHRCQQQRAEAAQRRYRRTRLRRLPHRRQDQQGDHLGDPLGRHCQRRHASSAGGLGILESGGQVTGDGSGSSLFIASGGTFEFASGTNGGSNIKPLSGATLEVGSGAAFAVNKIDAGITVKVLSGAALTLSGATISAGALVETLSGGTSDRQRRAGQFRHADRERDRQPGGDRSGAVVSGGAVVVGNGIVDVLSGGSANVAFLSTGSGGLEIADNGANPSTFTGTVSGFGGVNHTNHKQFIDLVSVTSAANTISLSYVSARPAAARCRSRAAARWWRARHDRQLHVGEFSITAGSSGTVEIVDPTVVNGGSVEPGPAQAFPRHGLDLPDIAFGAQTTLAYSREKRRHRRHADGDRRPPRRGDRAPRQLHGRKLRHHGRRPRRHAGHARRRKRGSSRC